MPTRSILDRLGAGDVLLMDGGTGSELHRRGVNISKGATVEKRPSAPPKYASTQVPGVNYRSVTGVGVWSAPANLEAPDVVRQVHEDYLKVGADIIITNTFYTTRAKLAEIAEQDRWQEYARRAVELAREARSKINPEAYLAGGFAPPFTGNLREELGYEENPSFGTSPKEQFFVIEGKEYTPERYAGFARDWKAMGAQVIGGCCGTGPEHIQAVRAAIQSQ